MGRASNPNFLYEAEVCYHRLIEMFDHSEYYCLYCTDSESVWANTHSTYTVITEVCLIHDTNNNRLSRKQGIHLRYS